MKIKYVILMCLVGILVFSSLVTSDKFGYDITTDNQAVTVNINSGSGINDTNASTACSGTQYLAGNGSCLSVSDIGGDTNETTRFNALTNTDCGAGNLVIGVQDNGTVLCATDQTGGGGGAGKSGGSPYLYNDSTTIYLNDTVLNSTIDDRDSDTTYTNGTGINLTGNTFSIVLSYFTNLFIELTDSFGGDVSGTYDNLQLNTDSVGANELNESNISNANFINDAGYITSATDTNETTRFDALTTTDCTAGSLVIGIQDNGTVLCATDVSGTGGKSGGGSYLYNDTTSIYLNDTVLNNTIDDRAVTSESDPIYTAENGTISRTGTCPSGQFIQNTTTNGVECDSPSGSGDITSVQGDNVYIYNGSASGDVVLEFNETYLNNTIDSRDSDTTYSSNLNFSNGANYWNDTYATFNKTYADTLYDPLGGSETDPLWTGNQSSYSKTAVIESWGYWNDTYATFNKTYADTLYADISVTGDNSSWNESYADTKYLQSYTETDPLWSSNYTAYNDSWSSTYNATYDAYNSSGLIKDWNNTGLIINWSNGIVDTNVLTDGDFNSTQMENNGGVLNILPSWLTSFINSWFGGKTTDDLTEGSTNLYDNSSWNESYADTKYSTGAHTVDTDTHLSADADNYLYNDSTTISFNETYLNNTIDSRAGGDNSSWNESYADTKYIAQADEGNLNVNSSNYWDGLNTQADLTITESQISDLTHTTDTDTHLSADADYYLYNDSTTISLNETKLNATIDDRASGTETDPLWTGNQSNVAFTNIAETFDDNLTVSGNLTIGTGTTYMDLWYNGTVDLFDTLGYNAVFTDNVTADYFIGDGSLLQNLPSGTTYTNGSGISLVGTEFNHSDTSSQTNEDNSGNTFIQDITLDTFGHITSIVSAAVDLSSYFTSAQILGFGYYNDTNFPYNSNLNFSNGANYWNDTYATFNKTYADTLYSTGAHTTDTNASTACSGDTTYLDGDNNCDDISGVYVDVSGDTMTGNLNMNTLNITFQSGAMNMSSNSSCIKIYGSTSILEIC